MSTQQEEPEQSAFAERPSNGAPHEQGPVARALEVRRNATHLCEQLAEALKQVGVKLPSLAVDLPSYAGDGSRLLIDLGRCSLATAEQLVAVLERSQSGVRDDHGE